MTGKRDFAAQREDYARASLDVLDVDPDPFEQFLRWFDDAEGSGIPEANAMTLATATPDGRPSARIVLLKGVDERGFAFYTNRESRKVAELAENKHAALLFHWEPLSRQIRIEGTVEPLSQEESAEYFKQRPRGSQLGAWASPQSRMIASREVLEERLREIAERFEGRPVACPGHWGGYVLHPEVIEFWQGRENRLHDRVVYRRAGDDGQQLPGGWERIRLAP